MTATPNTLYITGDGGLFKLGKGAMAKVAAGADWLDAGRALSATWNHRTETWRNLPAALGYYADEGPDLFAAQNGVQVLSYDDTDEIIAICEAAS